MKFSKTEKLFILLILVTLLVCFLVNQTGIYSIDFATSIIPGWHTTLFPFHIILLILLSIVLILYLAIKIIWHLFTREK